jgi:dUTPase
VLPLSAAGPEQRDHFAAERRQIVRLAASNEIAVDNDLAVGPFRPGVLEVCLQRRSRSHCAAAHGIRLDQRPGTVADRGDRLASVDKATNKGD